MVSHWYSNWTYSLAGSYIVGYAYLHGSAKLRTSADALAIAVWKPLGASARAHLIARHEQFAEAIDHARMSSTRPARYAHRR